VAPGLFDGKLGCSWVVTISFFTTASPSTVPPPDLGSVVFRCTSRLTSHFAARVGPYGLRLSTSVLRGTL